MAVDIIRHQISLGTSFDFISADGYYGNDASFASSIEDMGILYMLDIHSDQPIYLERPELVVPGRKSNKGQEPKNPKPTTISINVDQYANSLEEKDWLRLKVRNTAKGVLEGKYHFVRVYIWNKGNNLIESRLLVIRKTKSKKNTIELKFSFTNANLEQYAPEGLAYMQAQRFFIEHCIKESKQILGLDQFQTRKWNSWVHQVALNFLVSSFILKEKLLCFDDIPLLSARDVKEFITFKLYKEMTEEQVIDRIYKRHFIRQIDINRHYL